LECFINLAKVEIEQIKLGLDYTGVEQMNKKTYTLNYS